MSCVKARTLKKCIYMNASHFRLTFTHIDIRTYTQTDDVHTHTDRDIYTHTPHISIIMMIFYAHKKDTGETSLYFEQLT